MKKLWQRSALELASAIANREVSATEVVQAHLDRVDVVNDRVNAVTRLLADDALQAAKEADRAVLAGEPLGPGDDIGGSLRNPAYCCGIAALKPSLNRLPHASYGDPQDPMLAVQLMAVDGPMARRVADVRQAFMTMAGAHPRDPFAISAP